MNDSKSANVDVFLSSSCVHSVTQGIGGKILEGPHPMTSEVGHDVNITCRISMTPGEPEAVRWTRIVDVGTPTGETIYTYPLEEQPKKTDKYQILKNGQNMDLRILNLDFYDGGFYYCSLVVAAETRGAELVVLSEFSAKRPNLVQQGPPPPFFVVHLFLVYCVIGLTLVLDLLTHRDLP